MLRIEQLRKSYHGTEVLRGIDLTVEPGQVVCLIGASGSGKSTLLRCLNLLETVDDGTVWLADESGAEQDVTDPRVDVDGVRRRVGIVFQAYNLFPHLSVLQNLVLAPTRAAGVSRQAARERALALLERVGLADKASAYPDSLSGGQQQRVALARARALDPAGLRLAEITSALDPVLVGEVLDVVKGLRADGIAVVMATHEMAFAREASDVVAFLADGEIVEIGPPEQLFDAPQDPRTAAFLARFRD
ncbi:amino acid ABC transporter ATP-binding protein [Aeromicrobium sp.]|uniref:amino acid ABC transporter ATP-binding protein n=1 Tax=Aeromicrobium sp. TaxID=1871063 RepID=UPI003512F143